MKNIYVNELRVALKYLPWFILKINFYNSTAARLTNQEIEAKTWSRKPFIEAYPPRTTRQKSNLTKHTPFRNEQSFSFAK